MSVGTTESESVSPSIVSEPVGATTWAIEPTVATDALGRPLNYYITRGPQGPTLLGSWPDATADEIVLAHAAPDLLNACKLALTRMNDGSEVTATVAKHVRAAVSKATGATP